METTNAQIQIQNFIASNQLTIKVTSTFQNPNLLDDKWKANHYLCVIAKGAKFMSTYYSMGLGLQGEPELSDVLDSLAMDAQGYENAGDFEDWANEYGYDTDSRKAEKTYNTIGEQSKRLRKLLGRTEYTVLLEKVERL